MSPTPSRSTFRLCCSAPFAGAELLSFLGTRAIPGVEAWDGERFSRTLRLPGGWAAVTLRAGAAHVDVDATLQDPGDLDALTQRCRRLVDADADSPTIDGALQADPVLEPLIRACPGLRVPGCVDGGELAIRAVLGQQVSVAAARTQAGRIAHRLGTPMPAALGALTHLFPSTADIAESDPAAFPMPKSKATALITLSAALATQKVVLDPHGDHAAISERLVALRGIGPWTAAYIAMRALGDRDAFLPSDLGIANALKRLGLASDPNAANALATGWRPYRAYAAHHLWASLST